LIHYDVNNGAFDRESFGVFIDSLAEEFSVCQIANACRSTPSAQRIHNWESELLPRGDRLAGRGPERGSRMGSSSWRRGKSNGDGFPLADSGIKEVLTVIPPCDARAEQGARKSKTTGASEKAAMINLSLDYHMKRLGNDMGSFDNRLESFANCLKSLAYLLASTEIWFMPGKII
jgi:hypothetical protein